MGKKGGTNWNTLEKRMEDGGGGDEKNQGEKTARRRMYVKKRENKAYQVTYFRCNTRDDRQRGCVVSSASAGTKRVSPQTYIAETANTGC